MDTALESIFAKPVDRPIDGVIKADDEASLRNELDEYVITDEIGKRLETFFEAYNNYDTANGVWISGFFGSGKSHLLKMLALLMENREVGEVRAFDVFAGKISGNPMLSGLLRRAVSVPSKSILFNIDQKADIISKKDVEALLSVFQRVFDETCGYYGKQPHIAQFERDLDGRGELAAFKSAYEAAAGKSWERGREEATLEGKNIATAYAAMRGGDLSDTQDILGKYRKDTRISIEDFATNVKRWIDKQVPNFRLNFFVDEVGQYIAESVKLMTNLQTIAESLNTKCKGQAWVIVTSQQDMEAIIGDDKAFQSRDFSKIMARFGVKMPLNSADVAEVIQCRLLSKSDHGAIAVGSVYDREKDNLKTLFDFMDGSIDLKNFESRERFIASYPFPPYQYDLFQMAIKSLSDHNAFEGKHSSVGERSMLGVFQEVVAKEMKCKLVGDLATFDMMFAGIRTALKSSSQRSIQLAEKAIQGMDSFAVRVLKVLFLVKYIKEFKPTVRNISVLLLSRFDTDQVMQKRNIEEALSLLERNTLIQRNGEVYEFLTNEEKDIENEIKKLDVDSSERSKEMEVLVFDEILRHRKIKHLKSGNDYGFSRMLDDHLLGRASELSINVISPGDDSASLEAARMRTMALEELVVVLRPDERFFRDLMLYKQTDKFMRQGRAGSESRSRIIAEKGLQNSRRFSDLKRRLQGLMAGARMFVRGNELLNIKSDVPEERIVQGFQSLVDMVYTNLTMLRSCTYAESDILASARGAGGMLGSEGLTEAEQEVLSTIQRQEQRGAKVPVNSLVKHFGEKPYGWPTPAVLCFAAGLSSKGKVEARLDGSVLEGEGLARALNNSRALANILLTPQTEFTSAQLRKAKGLYKDLFGRPSDGSEARTIGAEWAESIEELSQTLSDLLGKRSRYPFLAVLEPLAARVGVMVGKPATWYIVEPAREEEALLAAKEVLDKVRGFMGGGQRAIYDAAREFLGAQEVNIPYVDSAAGEGIAAALADPACYEGKVIQTLNADLYSLKERVELRVLEERKAVLAVVEECAAKVVALPGFQALASAARVGIEGEIARQKARVGAAVLIPVLRELAASTKGEFLPHLLDEIAPAGVAAGGGAAPVHVSVSDVQVVFAKDYLVEESDVAPYVAAMGEALLEQIRAGKKVILWRVTR